MYHFLLLWTFWPLSRFEIWIVFFFHKHSKWASSIGKFLRQSCFCAIKMMLKTKSDNVRQCKENKSPWILLFLVHLLSRCRAARMGSSRTPGRAFKCQIEQLWWTAELIMLIFHNLLMCHWLLMRLEKDMTMLQVNLIFSLF